MKAEGGWGKGAITGSRPVEKRAGMQAGVMG